MTEQEPSKFMDANQIKKIYQAMSDNAFSTLELELGKTNRVRLVLDSAPQTQVNELVELSPDVEVIPNTQVEIRSDKVGTFFFAERQLKAGDRIKKGEILGTVKGISFQDRIKCSLDGKIGSVKVENGSIVDYGRLLFLVDID